MSIIPICMCNVREFEFETFSLDVKKTQNLKMPMLPVAARIYFFFFL